MPRRSKNDMSPFTTWFLSFTIMLVFSGFVYIVFALLEQDYLEAIDQRDLESRENFISLKQRRLDRIEARKLAREKDKEKLKRSGLMLDSVDFKESAFWAYEGDKAPAEWANLSSDYVMCAHGTRQSPIDLADPKPTPSLPELSFQYKDQDVYLQNDGKTVYFVMKNESFLKKGRSLYRLHKVTFHSPSEHFQDGAPYDMEIQFHHLTTEFQRLVVSVFVDATGQTNQLLAELWKDLPQNNTEEGADLTMNPRNLLPVNRRYYTYEGSMTTPPCREDTTWIVMETPIIISIRQFNAYRKVIRKNSRPIQKQDATHLKISRVF